MSSNRHKTVMCSVCGKVMRSDTLQRHMSTKHGNSESVAQRGDGHQSQRQATFETDARAEDASHDRLLGNGPTEALKPDLGKKKFILTLIHRQLMASGSSAAVAGINRDMMQSIHQP